MAALVQNRQFFPVIMLPVTSASHTKIFLNFKEFTRFFLSQIAFASNLINDDIYVFIAKLNRVFSSPLYIFMVNCVLQNKTSFQLE